MTTEAPTELVTFYSKYPDPVICLDTPWTKRTAEGVVYDKYEGEHIWFKNHVAKVTPAQAEKLRAKTTERDTFAMLYGRDFWEPDRNAPGQLYPTVKEQTMKITRLAAAGDVEGLGKLLDEERDTHNRPEVIDQGFAALETIESN